MIPRINPITMPILGGVPVTMFAPLTGVPVALVVVVVLVGVIPASEGAV